jgi:hypothetical protein
MSKAFDHTRYRDQIIVSSKSGYYLKADDHPVTLLQFPSLEEAERHVDSMLAEIDNSDPDTFEIRQTITKVVNDPALLQQLAEQDQEVARKVVEVARLCGLLKEATSL